MRIDLHLAHTLRRLNDPEFVLLLSALRQELAADLDTLSSLQDMDSLRRLQGKTQFLKTLLKSVAEASETIKKLS